MFDDFIASLKSLYNSEEVRSRFFFTFLMLVILRFLTAVPLPGIPADSLEQLFSSSTFTQTLSELSGGLLATTSVVAIGIIPYINASIIIQLLGSVVPKLEELRKEGTQGRKILTMYTRYLTFPLAILQSVGIYVTLRGSGIIEELPAFELVLLISTLTAGAMLVMWIGEQITEYGVGQGSSFIIMLGIVATFPALVNSNLSTADLPEIMGYVIVMLALVATIVLINEGERRVDLMFSRRVRDGASQSNYIPVKIAQFGVMPVIFASALVSFPAFIASIIVQQDFNERATEIAADISGYLNDPLIFNVSLFVLVILFSFFYVTVIFNPDEYAENLQKQGAFIPGIRPGEQTAQYLSKVSMRLTVVGALFLGILSVLPTLLVVMGIFSSQIVSGTSLLITVGVLLNMRRQIASMIVVKNYDSYY